MRRRGQGVRRKTVSLKLVQRTREGVRVVSEQRRVLGGGEGQLSVEEHPRRDAAVEAEGTRWYQRSRARVQSWYRRVEVGQEGRVENRRTHGDVRPGTLRAWWSTRYPTALRP